MKFNVARGRIIKKCPPLYKASVKIYGSIHKRIEVILWKMQGKPVPPPHFVKQPVVRKYAKKFRIEVLVETGTYHGAMVEAMKNQFRGIHSIEIYKPLYEENVKKFSKCKHIFLHLGDSAYVLPRIMNYIREPIIFWFGEHFSGTGTGKGSTSTPIMKELECVFNHGIKNHVILIDDARFFIGKDDYPTLQELKEFVLKNYPKSTFNVEDDIIRICP
jgi:hypothetical protein